MPNIRCLSFTSKNLLPQLGQELLSELATTLHLLQTLFSMTLYIYLTKKKSINTIVYINFYVKSVA